MNNKEHLILDFTHRSLPCPRQKLSFRGHSYCDAIGRNPASDHGTSPNHASPAHHGTIQKRYIRAYPDIVFNSDALARSSLAANRNVSAVVNMILRVKAHVLSHDNVLSD